MNLDKLRQDLDKDLDKLIANEATVPHVEGMNEAETRAEYIDPALKAAGWGVVGMAAAYAVKNLLCDYPRPYSGRRQTQ